MINALHLKWSGVFAFNAIAKIEHFFENKFQKEDIQRSLFSKFFPTENTPNIIPIGTAGNVQDSDSFSGLFQEILKISKIRSVGVQDGDIWLKSKLADYLSGKANLTEIIKALKKPTWYLH